MIEYFELMTWVIAGASVLRAAVPEVESMPIIGRIMKGVGVLSLGMFNAKPLRGASMDEINAEIKRRGL